MSLPSWSSYDAQFFRALSKFPDELEGKYLGVAEFVSYFKDYYGRPVQDIVEALYLYGQSGYFKADILLGDEYLESAKALDPLTRALDQIRPEPEFDEHCGLSRRLYTKVVTAQPLNKAEVLNLPARAKNYLEFRLSNIERHRLHEELVIYDNSYQPSRLVKSAQTTKFPPLKLTDIKLVPESYDKRKGVLHLAPFHLRAIAGKTGVKRPKGGKYMQCWIMECLFKSDRTLLNGVEISTILNVSKSVFSNNDNMKRKIQNAVAEINKKVAEAGGPKKLLRIDSTKVIVEQSYL